MKWMRFNYWHVAFLWSVQRWVTKCGENLVWKLVDCLNCHAKRVNVLLQTRENDQKFEWGNNIIQAVF